MRSLWHFPMAFLLTPSLDLGDLPLGYGHGLEVGDEHISEVRFEPSGRPLVVEDRRAFDAVVGGAREAELGFVDVCAYARRYGGRALHPQRLLLLTRLDVCTMVSPGRTRAKSHFQRGRSETRPL